MSSEGAFSLLQLSKISSLRKRVDRHFSADAREMTYATFMFARNFNEQLPCVKMFPGQNAGSSTKQRIFPANPNIPRPVVSAPSLNAPRLQEPGPVRDVFEIFGDDITSLQGLTRGSIACSPSLGHEMDVDHRAACSVFRAWRDMFDVGGSLATFSAICIKNDLAYIITHHPVKCESIPELSMVFNVQASPCSRHQFLCSFDQNWFQPERFSLSVLGAVTEQLVQLINGKLRRVTQSQENYPCNMQQLECNPTKRPALEK